MESTKLMDAAIAKQVRVELVERGMEQQALADAMGIEPATLNRYLMGHVNMKTRMFLKLAEALDMAPSVILGRAEARLAAAPAGQNPQTPNG